MTPVAAGSAIGAAALTVGRGVLGAAAGGLSFAAELTRAAVGDGNSRTTAAAGDSKLGEALQSRRDELAERIQRILAERNIALIEPVELVSDGMGGIAVCAGHPQQAAIEEALGHDLLLERDFQQLAMDWRELSDTGRTEGPSELRIAISKQP